MSSPARPPARPPADLRGDFPTLARTIHGKPLVYLDNAASAQKPRFVMDAMEALYAHSYANVHRGLHTLSNESTSAYEGARKKIKKFLNAQSKKEIIFTSGGTDAINLVAAGFLAPRIKPGDEIVLSVLEHHSNIVPWHFFARAQRRCYQVGRLQRYGKFVSQQPAKSVFGADALFVHNPCF